MGKLVVNKEKLSSCDKEQLLKICPFNAMEIIDGNLTFNAGCKMCKLCVKKSDGVVTFVEEQPIITLDKSKWKGIAVYGEIINNVLHPVTRELLGEARRLADKIGHPVYAILIGYGIDNIAKEIIDCGADEIFVYDDVKYKDFLIERYTDVFCDFIHKIKPSSILVGSTNLGRQLTPRVACKNKSGLTADCTMLDIKDNSDLVQIRPAFGGNIMAQIVTTNTRPQFCTVRYKIFDRLDRPYKQAKITSLTIDKYNEGNISWIETKVKPITESLEDADVIVAIGRGVAIKDIDKIKELCNAIKGNIACTRPLVENGTFDAKYQIGLSGRTVKPKLIITFGISGAVQFTAGMQNSEMIIAINNDKSAPIFDVAHVCVVADYNVVLPQLLAKIKENQ